VYCLCDYELVDGQQHVRVPARAGDVAGQHVHQRPGLSLGHRGFGRALQDAVPGVRVREAARGLEAGPEPAPQAAEPQRHVGDQVGAGTQRRERVVIAAGVGGREPGSVEPAQEIRRVGRRGGRRVHGQRHDRLHHVGVVGRRAVPVLDQVEQGGGQPSRRQVPQGQVRVVRPDRRGPGARVPQHPARPVRDPA